jgi:hypothetical protein
MKLAGKSIRAWSLLAVAALVALFVVPLAAQAGGGEREFDADLKPVPHKAAAVGGSHVTGDVDFEVKGRKVTIEVEAKGLAPNLVHAQHIHGIGDSECPTKEARNDRIDDGIIDTSEGLPDYGPINISLTTRGDTSPASGLAVERFPVANKGGKLNYERTFTIGKNFPRGVARNLERFQVVVHGIDANDNDMYDFGSLGKSDLDPSLPQEATIPAACGVTSHEH